MILTQKTVVIHSGLPKCASTSLQSIFSGYEGNAGKYFKDRATMKRALSVDERMDRIHERVADIKNIHGEFYPLLVSDEYMTWGRQDSQSYIDSLKCLFDGYNITELRIRRAPIKLGSRQL